MQSVANILRILRVALRSLSSLYSALNRFLQMISRLIMRATGVFLLAGGLLATFGWLLASSNPNPLADSWLPAIWLVLIGATLLSIGMLSLYLQHALRTGSVGMYGVVILFGGLMALIVGAYTVDGFILPWMFKLIHQIPNFSGQVQSLLDTSQHGVNTATTATTDTANQACQGITSINPFGGGSSCPTASAPTAPSATVPTLDGPTLINGLLQAIGIPGLSTLGIFGLSLLSGIPLSLGCLILCIAFLVAGVRPRAALLLVIVCCFLNLGGQFLLHLAFLGPLGGVLLFLSLAWLGLTLWLPGIHVRLPFISSYLDTLIAASQPPINSSLSMATTSSEASQTSTSSTIARSIEPDTDGNL